MALKICILVPLLHFHYVQHLLGHYKPIQAERPAFLQVCILRERLSKFLIAQIGMPQALHLDSGSCFTSSQALSESIFDHLLLR